MGVRLRTASGYTDLYVLFRGGVAVAATEGAGLDAGWYEASDMDIAAAELPAGVYDGAFLHGDWENPAADDAEEGVFGEFRWDGSAEQPPEVTLADGAIASATFAAGAIDNAAVSFDLDLAFDDADIKQFFVTGLSEQTSAFVESGSLGKRLVDNVDATISSRLAPSVAGRTLSVSAAGNAAADVALWRGTQPNTLSSGRVETLVGAMNSGVITSSVIASGALNSHTIGVNSLTQAALAQFATTDTGQGSGVSGSVVNLSQGSADPVAIRQEIDNNSTKLAAILADTGTTLPAAIGNIDLSSVLDVLGTPAGESIAADIAGVATSVGEVAEDVAGIATAFEPDGEAWRLTAEAVALVMPGQFTQEQLDQVVTALIAAIPSLDPLSPRYPARGMMWRFDDRRQTTSAQVLVLRQPLEEELVGFDLRGVLPAEAALHDVGNVVITPTSGVAAPTLGAPQISTDGREIHVPITADGTATRRQYRIDVTFTTKDGQTKTRSGVMELE